MPQISWKGYAVVCVLMIGSIFLGSFGTIVLTEPTDVHYHANIAIFIRDQKVNLNDTKYMEDTTKCAIDPSKQQPEDRTHFHENNGDLVHVHAAGVTWGHLMGNIGWTFGKGYIVDDTGKIYETTPTETVHFILNGKAVINPFNTLIKSENRLLVYYGKLSDTEIIKTLFPQVADTAHEANSKDDPKSCEGPTHRLGGFLQNMFHTHK